MALKKRPAKRHLLEIGLNITSLIDVMTVLIFFLVKSMTVTSVVISPPPDLNIPKATSETNLESTVSVSMSKNEIRYNNQVVITLEDGVVNKQYFDKDQRTIKPLKALLEKAYQEKFKTIEAAAKTGKVLRDTGKKIIGSSQVTNAQRLPAQTSPNAPSYPTVNDEKLLQGKIIIQADKDLPFHSIQFLLHTAAVSGFVDYQFVVAPK